jgi:hypothetical protein
VAQPVRPLQVAGRTRYGTRLRPSGRRVTGARCGAEPLHSAGHPSYGPSVIKRTTNSVSSAFARFIQQSRSRMIAQANDFFVRGDIVSGFFTLALKYLKLEKLCC